MTETRADVYSRITDQIAAAIEAGAGECRKRTILYQGATADSFRFS